MKIINVAQGSQEWLDWRKTVITATDCPAIMGSSIYQSPYQCWQRKLGLIKEQKSNEAMERGKRLEPYARECFIKEYKMHMTPIVIESSEHEFLGASLDGISTCNRYILEIKCGGQTLHEMAKAGSMPDHYRDQMQHQLLVTGAEMCFYYSFDGSKGVCSVVLPDLEFQKKFLIKAKEFWRMVSLKEPPLLSNSDYKNMEQCDKWDHYAKEYQNIIHQINALEKYKEYIRENLISLCTNQNGCGSGIKVMKTTTKGKISYDHIPELKEIDLEKYRTSPTSTWRIILEKNNE